MTDSTSNDPEERGLTRSTKDETSPTTIGSCLLTGVETKLPRRLRTKLMQAKTGANVFAGHIASNHRPPPEPQGRASIATNLSVGKEA